MREGMKITEEKAAPTDLALEGLRRFRQDLLDRIGFLSSGRAQVRIRHEEEWIDASEGVLANLYRQLGEVGSLIHALAAPSPEAGEEAPPPGPA